MDRYRWPKMMDRINACELRAVFALTAMTWTGCFQIEEPPTPVAKRQPQVYVVSYALQYFVQRIAGDSIGIHLPVPADIDPAHWRPEAAQLAAYQTADLILLNGADYAKWIATVTLPSSRMVDTSAGYFDQLIPLEDRVVHSHGPGGQHAHGGLAVTTWLDFSLARQQAAAVREALIKLLPEQADKFNNNFSALDADLVGLDESMQEAAQRFGNEPLVASHPVYEYLARRYRLNLRTVSWEPDVVPGEDARQPLPGMLAEHPAKWMIWEAEPPAASVEQLATLGVGSVVFDPCANQPDGSDWLQVMRENIAHLTSAAGN